MWLLDTTLIPLWWWQITALGLGVIIGSFLNVYIYRFHTGKSLAGSSHCLSCGISLRWYDLFPLLSYMWLRGRCRACGCGIPARYFLVELSTGLLFVGALWLTTDLVLLFWYWWVFSVLVVITVYDLYHYIIPDKLTIILISLMVVKIIYEFFVYDTAFGAIGTKFYTAFIGSGFFFVLWWYSKGRWLGFGDVKLALPLGLLVGPKYVFSFVVLSFWIGAGVSLLLIAWGWLNRGKAHLHLSAKALTIKSAVPFAPFLIAGSLVVLFTKFNVLALFSFT